MKVEMFDTKLEVDRHVERCLKKINNETERNLKCLAFARLYFKVGAYEQARRYVSAYLSVKPLSAEALLLHGKCLEKQGKLDAAVDAYRKSLEIDPKQNSLVLKVCELLSVDDVVNDLSGAHYFCEMAHSLDPHNPAVFNLKERLVTAESQNPEDITKLLFNELEARPTDVQLHVRYLRHLVQTNKVSEAYMHTVEIEQKDKLYLLNNLKWYETISEVLLRYQKDNTNSSKLTWEFWSLLGSTLDRLARLTLDEHLNSTSDCVAVVFNFDQTLKVIIKNLSNCKERSYVKEFVSHYRAQLCFHLATLLLKQAKKDLIKYKDAMTMGLLPLLFASYHTQPAELHSIWLNHTSEIQRLQVQRWHKEAAYRCSQTGHILLGAANDTKGSLIEKAMQNCTGIWRENLYKRLFVTRHQQAKMQSSTFVTDDYLLDIQFRLPDNKELEMYDQTAQLIYPDSLHHSTWICMNQKPPLFKCTIFDGLQYSVKNLNNCAAETLNVLDIEAFLYCTAFTAQQILEQRKNQLLYNTDKPNVLPAAITPLLGTLNQANWWTSAYKMYKNEYGSNMSEVRLRLISGIEVVRCIGNHGLDVKLLIILARIFAERANSSNKQSEIEFNNARAELYWKAALPLLDKLQKHCAVMYPVNRLFEYKSKEFTSSEVIEYIEEGKLFNGTQLMKKMEHDRAIKVFETLRSPYASFNQAQIYKTLADELNSQENITSEMRSRQIILLSKSRDCLYLTLDRLRDPSVDGRHPLNAQLGNNIELIERLLNTLDPDNSNRRNECDGMSDENISVADSIGDYIYNINSFNSGRNESHTPQHDRSLLSTRNRTELSLLKEARPSPERLDAQIRRMQATRDVAVTHILEQTRILGDSHRSLVEEMKNMRQAITNITGMVQSTCEEFNDIQETMKNTLDEVHNFREVSELVKEIKKEIADLKKDGGKPKNNQLNDEDLYVLDEEYGNDYVLNANMPNFNAGSLYQNYQPRMPAANTLNYPPAALYPGLYPLYPYANLGLAQAGALPFGQDQIPDYRALNPLSQSLPQANFSQPKSAWDMGGIVQPNLSQLNLLPQQPPLNIPPPPQLSQAQTDIFKDVIISTSNTSTSLSTTTTQFSQSHSSIPKDSILQTSIFSSTAPSSKAPANVVITSSDPLPKATVQTTQVLSVTIPPQHIKGNQLQKSQPHNYQIPLPTTTTSIFTTTPSIITQPSVIVSTHSLLSNVSAPVYSSIEKSPFKNTTLGVQIDKVSDNCRNSNLNNSSTSSTPIKEHDPCPDFMPVIPLPDEVPVNTGEENEIILFSERVKLFRYANKEWKERGVGTLKILRNKDTGKCRILMRRDQVYKICANHFLTRDMLLTQMPNNTRAYSWAAHDYADEQMVVEKLCARFKTEEEAGAFCRAFEKAKEDIVTEANTSLGGFIFTSTPTFKPKDKTLVPNITVKEDVKASSPFAYFSFGIGLTPVIDVKTAKEDKCDIKPEKPSEENMEILFESGAKLLQFDLTNKEWKQKGTGIMKLLKGNTIRLVMRQEQDHSVCCDHQLLKTMQFTKMANNSKGLTWKVGSDLNAEMFGVKFKSEEQSEAFYKAVTSAQDLLDKHDCSTSDQKVPIPEIISFEFKDQSKCKEDKKVKSEAKVESQKLSGWGDKFKMKLGHWECKICYVVNEAKCHHCVACDTPKSNTSPKKPSDTQFSFGVNLTSASTVDATQKLQFTFGNTPTSVTSTSTTSSWGDAFKPKANSWECQQCLIRNDGNVLYCAACDSPKDDSVPKKETAKVGVNLETPGLKFSFGIPPKETKEVKGETKQAEDDVGISSTKESSSESSAPQYNFGIPSDTKSKPNSIFTLSSSDNITTSKPFVFSIGAKEADNGKKDSFVFGSPQKATFEFTPRSPRRHSSGCQGDEEGEGYVEDEGEHIYFKPVIPLPDKVEVKTGEEQEEVLYCHYAKLYRFVQGEWKERGIGDVKILLKCDTGRLRVIMRRDQVLKICLNYILTADIQYLKKDEKTWLFSVHDFSEGELSDSRFCLRFKSSSIAEEFRKAIDDALKKSKECLDATSSTSKDVSTSDVEFVSEAQVTPEEEAEAVNLKLPPKFMAYRQLPDCTCDTCKKDDELLSELFKTQPPKPEEQLKQQTTIFGDSNMLFGTPCKPFASNVANDKFIFGQPLKSDIFKSAASIEKSSTLREMLVKPSVLGSIETNPSKQGSEQTKTAAVASSPALKNFSFTISNSATPSKDNLFGMVTSTSSTTFGSSTPGNLFANPSVPTTLVNIFGGNTGKSLFTTSTIVGNANNAETTKTDSESKKETEELVLKCDPSLSFANLAASNKPADFASSPSGDHSKPFAFVGLGKPVFAKQVIQKKDTDHDKSETNEEAEGSDGEAEEYDPHYEPVVSLPEAIVVKTGEEDEVVLFNERAKLYRFDNELKEWKERGVGQMKILHHSTNGTYRFLLRREQVHKVVLNMLITSSIDLQPLSTSTSSWLWYGHNHTEDETALEKLAVRFKSEELAGRFYSAVQQVVCDIKETQESRDLPSTIQNYGIEQEGDTIQENDTIREIEGNEDDDDDDDDRTIMFLKPCKLSEQLETGEWIVSGTGQLQLYYDSNIYGSRISVVSEDGNILSNTLIGINTEMTVLGDSCVWKAVEWGETPPRWRMLKATFISENDAINLHYNYLESVQFAHESDLVDEIIVENSDSDEN